MRHRTLELLQRSVAIGSDGVRLDQVYACLDGALGQRDRVFEAPVVETLVGERDQVGIIDERRLATVQHLAQRLTNLELGQPCQRREPRDRPAPVHQLVQGVRVWPKLTAVDSSDRREDGDACARDPLADVCPLVDPARSLHDDAVAVEEQSLVQGA